MFSAKLDDMETTARNLITTRSVSTSYGKGVPVGERGHSGNYAGTSTAAPFRRALTARKGDVWGALAQTFVGQGSGSEQGWGSRSEQGWAPTLAPPQRLEAEPHVRFADQAVSIKVK